VERKPEGAGTRLPWAVQHRVAVRGLSPSNGVLLSGASTSDDRLADAVSMASDWA